MIIKNGFKKFGSYELDVVNEGSNNHRGLIGTVVAKGAYAEDSEPNVGSAYNFGLNQPNLKRKISKWAKKNCVVMDEDNKYECALVDGLVDLVQQGSKEGARIAVIKGFSFDSQKIPARVDDSRYYALIHAELYK